MLGRHLSQLTALAILIEIRLPFQAKAETDPYAWESSAFMLRQEKPLTGSVSYPWLDQLRGIMLRSLNSPDQARDLSKLHETHGTKALTSRPKYLGPLGFKVNPQQGAEVRRAVVKSVRLYAQKETKGNVFPESWKEGLRFQLGGSQGGGSPTRKGFIQNGNPEMRYGLRLKSIEPSQNALKIASLEHADFEYLLYAPKADLQYEVGEVYPEGYARSYPVSLGEDAPPKSGFRAYLPKMPDHKFSGRMAPRGLPGPGSPLPPQSLFLDQSQGYYQLEAQLTGNLKQENVLHRFRVPMYGRMNYRQERNKDWQFTKSTFENLYSNDDGYAVHLERYHLEKRYQLGFHFHKLINHFELYAHVPDTALEKDNFWRQHRWETRFDFHF